VRGYWALLDRGEPGEVYNLCSGKSWAIQQVLDFLLEQSRVRNISVQTDPARLRPSDVMVLEGDPSKIEKATGWKVEIPFERTLKDLLAYWRQRTWSSSR
jgi:GDP-4-dehydro-6-deoxy-D-mannose reductase